MTKNEGGLALPIVAAVVPPRGKASSYPEPYACRMDGRIKRALGDPFGLSNFGVNLTTLPPGSVSALHHRHSRQDEFIYVLEGRPTLHRGEETLILEPGMCVGFPAAGAAHHLSNESKEDVTYLEVGDRTVGDEVTYPHDDLKAVKLPTGGWGFSRKDGSSL